MNLTFAYISPEKKDNGKTEWPWANLHFDDFLKLSQSHLECKRCNCTSFLIIDLVTVMPIKSHAMKIITKQTITHQSWTIIMTIRPNENVSR